MNRLNYEKWVPQSNFKLDTVYDIENVYLDNGLIITLIPDNIFKSQRGNFKLKLYWESFLSFNITEESHKESLWIHDAKESWTFYKAKSSAYINFIKQDSILFPKQDVTHFLLIGTNLIADIISLEEPVIETMQIDL
ncbi:hypothetical protein ACR6HW_06230 [Fusibacter sp. JL298sf-3]